MEVAGPGSAWLSIGVPISPADAWSSAVWKQNTQGSDGQGLWRNFPFLWKTVSVNTRVTWHMSSVFGSSVYCPMKSCQPPQGRTYARWTKYGDTLTAARPSAAGQRQNTGFERCLCSWRVSRTNRQLASDTTSRFCQRSGHAFELVGGRQKQ